MQSTLILVIGKPATGKTALSKKLAEHLKLPLLSKDAIKEIIFDGLGWSDRAWSAKVGSTTYNLMDYLIEEQLKAGHPLIVETPLSPKFDNEKFQAWQSKYRFTCVQVLCYADGKVLLERFKQRAATTEQHPGHVALENIEEFKASLLEGKAEPLALKGTIVEVDTTDFSKVDEAAILEQVEGAVRSLG